MPAAFVDSRRGHQLAETYDALARSAPLQPDGTLQPNFEQIIDLLVPLLGVAHEWNLLERQTIAHGMALKDRTDI